MLTTWFMPAPSLPSESRMRSNVVRTSCSNVMLPLSGGRGTPIWPEMRASVIGVRPQNGGECQAQQVVLAPHLAHPFRECCVEIKYRLECDLRHMGVVLHVMHLIPGERRRIVDLDQRITAPSGAVGLDVTQAGLGPSPVAALGEGLERSSPDLVEFGFADSAAVFKSLEIQLAHSLTLPPLISPGTKPARQSNSQRLASNWIVRGSNRNRTTRRRPVGAPGAAEGP